MLRKNFKLGELLLPSNIFCAPLAGCSDLPFRRMTTRYRPGLVFCEMVKMDALVRHDENTYHLLDYEKEMHPIGAQLCGSKLHHVKEAARLIESLGFDSLDFNCGCPVDKVTKDGSGSGMLKNPELIGEIISTMASSVKIPVTVKIRTGWNEKEIVCERITEIAEAAGAKAICIHGRTREQGYEGRADWEWIRRCKAVAKKIVVIGNGDLFSASAVQEMFKQTGCDAALIARGTFGEPWIVEDTYRLLSGEPIPLRTADDYRAALLDHLEHVTSYQPPTRSAQDMRRIGCWYLKKIEGARKLRELINRSRSIIEIKALIEGYEWETA